MLLDFFFFLLYFAYLFESGISFRQLLIYYLFRNENGMEEGTRKKKRLEFHLPVELHRNRSLNLLKIRCIVFFFFAWSFYAIKKEINRESRSEGVTWDGDGKKFSSFNPRTMNHVFWSKPDTIQFLSRYIII